MEDLKKTEKSLVLDESLDEVDQMLLGATLWLVYFRGRFADGQAVKAGQDFQDDDTCVEVDGIGRHCWSRAQRAAQPSSGKSPGIFNLLFD